MGGRYQDEHGVWRIDPVPQTPEELTTSVMGIPFLKLVKTKLVNDTEIERLEVEASGYTSEETRASIDYLLKKSGVIDE